MVNLLPRGRAATLFTLWGTLLALLLPLYGSWLDPSFVGRLPFHNHIYLGEVAPHHHYPDASHAHAAANHEQTCGQVLSGVVSVPDGGVMRQIFLVWQLYSPPAIVPANAALTFIWQAEHWLVRMIFLPPPHRPPRPLR